MSRVEAAPDELWQADAECRKHDPELFFESPQYRRPEGWDPFAEARRICALCPVTVPCLELALRNRDQHGFYAGTTPDDRAGMRRAS